MIAEAFSRESVRARSLENMIAAVSETTLSCEPFPHFITASFFPADIYARILRGLPAAERYEPVSYARHANPDGSSNRFRFSLTNEALDALPSAQASTWLGIRDALGSPALRAAIYEKLSPGLIYRYGVKPEEVRDLPGYPVPELFRETSGYMIKPHPDTRRKVVTMQVALPRDESQKDLGTEFYELSPRLRDLVTAPHGFRTVKRVPFLPNVCYAFTVLNSILWRSWHGRSMLGDCPGGRNSLLNIYYERCEDGSADVMHDWKTDWATAELCAA